ncbi:MAG: hypothetical protein KF861_01865 [Planctomycetaceae bacterium]|nr:hypothetical protein [Planctomycetaceae bacterium]
MPHASAVRHRTRRDLLRQRISFGTESWWIVHDPVAQRQFYLSDSEHHVLSLLDGQRDLDAVRAAYDRSAVPSRLEPEALVGFLADAVRQGLVLTTPTPPGGIPALSQPRGRPGEWNPLAIRLPGINPTTILNWLAPLTNWIFRPWFLVIQAAVMVLALLLVLVRFDEFAAGLPRMQAWLTAPMVLSTLLAISATKIIHELAHALTCRRLGGRCEQMGLLLLVFCPSLYCDVSHAWLFPRRRDRMLVSAAGILAELFLASWAALLWWATVDGPLRMICMTVMVVCSVNTLLINGNPLLRYDGYFLLADGLGIPNLGPRATSLLQSVAWHALWGIPSNAANEPSRSTRLILLIYGVLSGCYRLMIVGTVLLVLHRLAQSYDVLILANVLAVVVLIPLVLRTMKPFLQPLTDSRLRPQIDRGRVAASVLILLAIGSAILWVPLPRHLTAPFVVELAETSAVYVATPGQLTSSVTIGELVEAGDVIGELSNLELPRELARLEAEQRVLARQLEDATARRGFSPDASETIPILTEALLAIEGRLTLKRRETEQLILKAPRSGAVLPPPNKPLMRDDDHAIHMWSETPLDPRNRGCTLDRGTLYCYVGDPQAIVATALVGQNDIELVAVGQPAELRFPFAARRPLIGTVVNIETSPVESCPRELSATHAIPVETTGREIPRPIEPHYRVQFAVEGLEEHTFPGQTGVARLEVQSTTLAARLWRTLRGAVTIDLY